MCWEIGVRWGRPSIRTWITTTYYLGFREGGPTITEPTMAAQFQGGVIVLAF